MDTRDEKETNENWDEETLKEVVEKKHGKESSNKPTTQIVRLFCFLLGFALIFLDLFF